MAKGDYGEKNGMCEKQLNWGCKVSYIIEEEKETKINILGHDGQW